MRKIVTEYHYQDAMQKFDSTPLPPADGYGMHPRSLCPPWTHSVLEIHDFHVAAHLHAQTPLQITHTFDPQVYWQMRVAKDMELTLDLANLPFQRLRPDDFGQFWGDNESFFRHKLKPRNEMRHADNGVLAVQLGRDCWQPSLLIQGSESLSKMLRIRAK